MAQQHNNLTGLPVWQLDDDGNTLQTGGAVTGDGVTLKQTPVPDNPSTGGLKVFTPDGEGLYTVDSVGNIDVISSGSGQGGTPAWFNVSEFGARGDGVTDDATAISNAITAAINVGGGVVYLPSGTYLVGSTLNMATRVNLLGDGKGASVIEATGNGIITFNANAFWWSIQGLTLKVNSGGHVIAGSHNLSAFNLTNCSLQQLDPDFSIWNQTTGQIVEAYVTFCDLYVDGDPRTVPAVYWSDPAGGFNANVIKQCVCTNNADDTQYFFEIHGLNANTDYTYTNTFRDLVFETCSGGGIKATSQFQLVIENCWMWDDPVGGIKNPPFYIGKEASGNGSRGCTIRNSGRLGNHLAAGVADVYLEASCQQTTIDTFRATPDAAIINLNGCAYTQFVNKSPGTILQNTSGFASYYADSDNHNNVALDCRVTGDADPRAELKIDGSLLMGPGNTAPDTNLYRGDVGLLQTDSAFTTGGTIHSGGDIKLTTAGNGLFVKEGTNARMGRATLTAGAATVSNTQVTASSEIFLTSQVDGGVPGWLRVDTRSAGVSFHIQSSSVTDTSTVAWLIVEPS